MLAARAKTGDAIDPAFVGLLVNSLESVPLERRRLVVPKGNVNRCDDPPHHPPAAGRRPQVLTCASTAINQHTAQKAACLDKRPPPCPFLQDPLVSLSVRVRWTELREGLVEESQHYTTLEPLPEEEGGGAAGSGMSGAGSGGQWFVSPRWETASRVSVLK